MGTRLEWVFEPFSHDLSIYGGCEWRQGKLGAHEEYIFRSLFSTGYVTDVYQHHHVMGVVMRFSNV